MSFTGIFQFGNLTTKNGQVINFDDIKTDEDGKMSQRTYNFIQKELCMDTVELSEQPQKGEKEVTDYECVLWGEEADMQEAFDVLCAQVAVDFIGENAKYSSQVIKELRQFLNDFKAENSFDGEKMVDMSERFIEELEEKYYEIKDSILGDTSGSDSEKIQKEWDEYSAKFERNKNNAKSIKEYVQLGREYLNKHREYAQKMLACDDLEPARRKELLESGKADMETAKTYTKLMSDGIDMQAATDNFIKNLSQNCPGWKALDDNPIIADPEAYMLTFSQTFEPSIIEPSMTQAYRKSLSGQYENLVAEYNQLVENGNIDVNEQVELKADDKDKRAF